MLLRALTAQVAPTDGAGGKAVRPAPPQLITASSPPRGPPEARGCPEAAAAQGPSGRAPRVGPALRGPAAPGGAIPSAFAPRAPPQGRGRPHCVKRRRRGAAPGSRRGNGRPQRNLLPSPPPPPPEWQPREPMRRAPERPPANPEPWEAGRGAPAWCAAPLAAPRAQRPSPQRNGAAAAADRADGRAAGPPYPRHRQPARLNLTCRPPPSGGGGSESSGCTSHSNRGERARRRHRDRITQGGDTVRPPSQSAGPSPPTRRAFSQSVPPVSRGDDSQWPSSSHKALLRAARCSARQAAPEVLRGNAASRAALRYHLYSFLRKRGGKGGFSSSLPLQ